MGAVSDYIDLAAPRCRFRPQTFWKFSRLYAVDGGAGEWSPNLLRKADYLAAARNPAATGRGRDPQPH